MAEQPGWQLERESAELYERFLVGPVTSVWAKDLVERVGLRPADRVLDVACGTGVVARLAASSVGGGGRVAALDVNRGMLAVARSLPAPNRAPIQWQERATRDAPSARPVGTRCCERVHVDRPKSGRERPRRSPGQASRRGSVAHERSEHSLAAAGELRRRFEEARFASVQVETVTQTVCFPSVEEWVEIQFAATPLATLVADRDPARRRHLIGLVAADVGQALAQLVSHDGFVFPQEAHVALAVA